MKKKEFREWLLIVKAMLIVYTKCKPDITLSEDWKVYYECGLSPAAAIKEDMGAVRLTGMGKQLIDTIEMLKSGKTITPSV